MLGLRAGAHHLRKKVNVVVSFPRHCFANLVQDGQKFWATIHAQYYSNLKFRTQNRKEMSESSNSKVHYSKFNVTINAGKNKNTKLKT